MTDHHTTAKLDEIEASTKEAIRLRSKGTGFGWAAWDQEQRLHKKLDHATILWLVQRARRCEELEREVERLRLRPTLISGEEYNEACRQMEKP